MNTEYRVKCSWRNTIRRKKLQRRLGAEGVLALLDLWAYAAEHHPSGDLPSMGAEEVALAADYGGDADALLAALLDSDYLERSVNGYRILRWGDESAPVAGMTSQQVYDGLRNQARRQYGAAVFTRDGGRCVYCQADTDLTIDHVIPLSRGGANTPENLATACRACNSSKNDRTPDEWRAR